MLLVLSPARESRWFTTKSDVLAFTQKTVPFPWPSTAECTAKRSWRSLRHRWCTGRLPFSPRILLFFRGKVKVWEGVARSVLNHQVASKSSRIMWCGRYTDGMREVYEASRSSVNLENFGELFQHSCDETHLCLLLLLGQSFSFASKSKFQKIQWGLRSFDGTFREVWEVHVHIARYMAKCEEIAKL